MKKYRVTLAAAKREQLRGLLARGKAEVRKLQHAQILLKADEAAGGSGGSDEQIAAALEVGTATVKRVRRRFVTEGLEATLGPYRGGKRSCERKLDGVQEAHLIALAGAPPPAERGRRTLRLLAEHRVALGYVGSLSCETVRQTLKKTRCVRT